MKDLDVEKTYSTDENIVMSRFVWESYNASHERTVKRCIAALIVAVLLLAGTNLAWLWVWNQYDFSSEEYVVENDGNSNLLGAGASMNEVSNEYKDGIQAKDSNKEEQGQE